MKFSVKTTLRNPGGNGGSGASSGSSRGYSAQYNYYSGRSRA